MIAFADDYQLDHQEQETESPQPAWHAGFLALLPQIRERLRFGFRRLPPYERAEAMAEAVAATALAYARLHARGRAAVGFATTLAAYAIRQYFAGRRVGGRLNSDDVSSAYAQRRRGHRVVSLDRRDPSGAWKEILLEDRRTTPAELAASRIDLEDWFDQLPRSKSRIAQALASGESTHETARRHHVTPGRVSQLRRELESDWQEFQSGALCCAS